MAGATRLELEPLCGRERVLSLAKHQREPAEPALSVPKGEILTR